MSRRVLLWNCIKRHDMQEDNWVTQRQTAVVLCFLTINKEWSNINSIWIKLMAVTALWGSGGISEKSEKSIQHETEGKHLMSLSNNSLLLSCQRGTLEREPRLVCFSWLILCSNPYAVHRSPHLNRSRPTNQRSPQLLSFHWASPRPTRLLEDWWSVGAMPLCQICWRSGFIGLVKEGQE